MAEELSIFQEIDEALRVDKFEQFWRQHHLLIIGVCAALVLGSAGWEYWKHYSAQVHGQQTAIIVRASQLEQSGKWSDVVAAIEDAKKGSAPIASVAALRQGQAWVKAGSLDKAQVMYEELAKNTAAEVIVRDYAALEANIIADNRHTTTSAPLPTATRAFAAEADELKAVRLLQAGKIKEAQDILKPLSEDATISVSARSRAMELLEGIGK